jgi:hypothetical protein
VRDITGAGRADGTAKSGRGRTPKYVGKTILIGITNLDHDAKLKHQWFGTILTFPKKGIRMKLRDSDKSCAYHPILVEFARLNPASIAFALLERKS